MSDIRLKEQIAVVSMGCLLPDANTPDEFWKNVVEKKVSIERSDNSAFDREVHFRPEMYGKSQKFDKTYTDVASGKVNFDFEGSRFRLPPAVCQHMDSNQKIMLLSAEQALSGVKQENWDRRKVSVFVGTSFVGELHHDFCRRVYFERFSYHLQQHSEFKALNPQSQLAILNDLQPRFIQSTPMISEDSAPGILPNIIAARICSVFDFHGHAYTIDAACASSLAAIIAGVQHLTSGEADVAICGGADMLNGEMGRIYFSGINALSPDGSFPFDERANGFVIGEGGGAVVLKRYSDAIASNDKIWALISGYGQNSDGKGKAIAAPNSKWQARAISDAISMAGFDASTIELIEAHGTSTKVGDKSEIDALNLSFEELGATGKHFCAVGSAKSNIGHLKAAAGVPGFLKAVLALHHKVLPPTANCEKVSPSLNLANSPFYINTEAKPWDAKSHPRRAGVSAFGFGGANYHIVLEEFRAQDVSHKLRAIADKRNPVSGISLAATTVSPSGAREGAENAQVEASSKLSMTLLVSAKSTDELAQALRRFLQDLASRSANESEFANLVVETNFLARAREPHRIGIAFHEKVELKAKIQTALQILEDATNQQNTAKWALMEQKGVFYKQSAPVKKEQIAFLFPGQASQYPDMCLSLPTYYPQATASRILLDRLWEKNCGQRITDLISSATRGVDATATLLKNTRNTHPALLFGSVVCHEILRQHGVEAGYMVGHSAGEISALQAAGVLDIENAVRLMDFRSSSFVSMSPNQPDGTVDFGKMAAVKTTLDALKELIVQSGAGVELANINSPKQLIVSGFSTEMNTFLAFLAQQKVPYTELNVSHAFHSKVVQPAADEFLKRISSVSFETWKTPVFANQDCELYPKDGESVRNVLYRQITGSVNFMGTIEKLFEKGVRVFVEVGPNNILSSLTRSILDGQDVAVISSNSAKKADLDEMQSCVAALFAEGVEIRYQPPHRVTAPQSVSVQNVVVTAEKAPASVSTAVARPRIVYSGVAAGLPGSYKSSFRDDNFEQLFEGRNFIEPLSKEEKSRLAALRVSKVEKTAKGPVFHLLESLGEVIQLAGKIGKIDALVEYQIDEGEIAQMSQAILHGVAAGYEALRDARIPLVHQYSKTASGNLLPDRWTLPEEMQRRTGVIFAHGFPMVETVVAEVTRHLNHKFAGQGKQNQIDFYQKLLPLISDASAKKILTDWFIENQSSLRNSDTDDAVFQFNHMFINQISSLANVRIAQYIQALGPNFQLNAACSSTCTAITLSEELIASGRVDRMLILAADDATSELSLPYLGAGFLSTGAASCEADVYEAAVPFDQRRNGMIISAGATALVIERLDEAQRRGVRPVCELLGSHVFNTAGHHARLNVPRYAAELKHFMDEMASVHGLQLKQLSEELLYVSHETYTPARGGCSEAEAESLRHVFGSQSSNILVTNTKGMTGHTMGASIEDVVAARCLESGKVPPVVNFKVPDPKLSGLRLSKGGTHSCKYALRMAAGFGSQGNYILLRRYDDKIHKLSEQNLLDPKLDSRIENFQRYNQWLKQISKNEDAKLELSGRILRVTDSRESLKLAHPSGAGKSEPVAAATDFRLIAGQQEGNATSGPTASPRYVAEPAPQSPAMDRRSLTALVFATVSEITGYAVEMLEADMEVENDLGIDTVKQATILSTLGEKLGVVDEFEFQIAAYPTLNAWIDLFAGMTRGQSSLHPAVVQFSASSIAKDVHGEPAKVGIVAASSIFERSHVRELVFATVSEITGYAPEMIEEDMEVENDLGIDTVKQATILGILGEKLGVADEFEFQIAAYPTIASWVELFAGMGKLPPHLAVSTADTRKAETTRVESVPGAALQNKNITRSKVTELVFSTISEITGYAPEMLAGDMEVENDLGIDTVKQATILGMVGEKLGVADEFEFQIAAYPTVDAWIDLFFSLVSNGLEDSNGGAEGSALPQPANNQNADMAVTLQSHCLVREKFAMAAEMADVLRTAALRDCHLVVIGWTEAAITTMENWYSNHCKGVTRINLASESLSLSFEALKTVSLASTDALIWLDVCAMDDGIDVGSLIETHFDLCQIPGLPKVDAFVSVGAVTSVHGALTGFYQSLAKEWGGEYRAVMVAQSGVSNDLLQSAVVHGLTRMRHLDSAEVAVIELTEQSVYAWRVATSSLLTETLESVADISPDCHFVWEPTDVLMVVGATGITARIAAEFSKKFPSRIALLDINELSSENYLSDNWSETAYDARKEEIRKRLSLTTGRVRPVDIESEFRSCLKQRELQQTISDLRSLGAEVIYQRCDVTDKQQVRHAVDAIVEKWGSIQGILHGAGVEQSGLLSKKSKSDFFRITNPKILGAQNLIEYAATPQLKLWTCFSSISGIFGNAAQVDYAAANAFLNYYTLELQDRFPGILARSIAWSGWAETGMAWRNSYVRENADKMGLHLIPPAMGSAKAVELMTSPAGPVIQIVHNGLGPMLDKRWRARSEFQRPLLDRIDTANNVTFYKTLDVTRDEWLNQHRLNNVPLVPGVGYLELMAEIYCWKNRFDNGIVYTDLRFHDAFKLPNELPRDVTIETSMTLDSAAGMPVAMRILSQMRGRLVSEQRLYCSATVSSAAAPAPRWEDIWEEPAWEHVAEHFAVFEGIEKLPQNVVFGNLFHDYKRKGADLMGMKYQWNENALMRDYGFPMEQLTTPKYQLDEYVINFCLMDSLHQAGVVHTVLQTQKVHLPCGAKEFIVYDKCDAPGRYRNYVRCVERGVDQFVYDVFLLNQQNKVCAAIYGCEFRKIS